MKVVVTGGAGFIGSRVVAELARRGHTPIPFDRRDGKDILTDPLPGADAVIHLAGVLGTAELFDTPELAIDMNMKGTNAVLRQCAHHSMRYVGITMPDAFPSIYTATKIGAARLATAWHHAEGVPVSHVRAFNAFGEGQKFGDGHPQKIVPTFASCGWRGQSLPIWGSGEQTVDLVYVDDVARMLCDAILFGDDDTFDAGTGTSLTVVEVARRVLEVTGGPSLLHLLPMRKGEPEHTVIAAKGEGWDLVGWHPEFRADDLVRTVESYRP